MVVESVLARPSRLLGGRGRTSARSGSVSKPPGARRGGILARPGPPGITGLAGPSSSPRVGRLPRSWSVPVMARPSPQSFFARSRPARSPSLGSTTTPDSRPGLVGVSEIVSTFQRRRRTRAPSIRHALATADLRHRPNPETPMIRRGAHFRAVVGAEPVGTRASEHSSPPCRKANSQRTSRQLAEVVGRPMSRKGGPVNRPGTGGLSGRKLRIPPETQSRWAPSSTCRC
jgi:hypothetical protein